MVEKRKRGRPRKEDSKRMKAQAAADALAACTPGQRQVVKDIITSLKSDANNETKGDRENCPIVPEDGTVRLSPAGQSLAKKSSKVRSALVAVMEAQGITSDLLVEVMKDGLTAREDHNDIMSKPERAIRHKYLETILKVRGDVAQQEASGDSWEDRVSIIINQQNNFGSDSQ